MIRTPRCCSSARHSTWAVPCIPSSPISSTRPGSSARTAGKCGWRSSKLCSSEKVGIQLQSCQPLRPCLALRRTDATRLWTSHRSSARRGRSRPCSTTSIRQRQVKPVLLIFEDLHWIDPSSLELLNLLVDRVPSLPLLAILTARPEFTPPWTPRAHAMVLTISRLARHEAAALAQRISGKSIPAEVLYQIVDRTDGVPLFVEELTRTVLELGLLEDAGDQYALRGPLPPLAIPVTLQDLAHGTARSSGRDQRRRAIRCVPGREFTHEMLAAVAPWDETGARRCTRSASRQRPHPAAWNVATAAYTFRHALVQEAAYQSLLRSKRRELHALIAKAVEARFPEMARLATRVARPPLHGSRLG